VEEGGKLGQLSGIQTLAAIYAKIVEKNTIRTL
jgi:hypothetical protein